MVRATTKARGQGRGENGRRDRSSRPPDDAEFFTINEAAKILKCHRKTIELAIREGRMPHTLLGRTYRIPRSAIYPSRAG